MDITPQATKVNPWLHCQLLRVVFNTQQSKPLYCFQNARQLSWGPLIAVSSHGRSGSNSLAIVSQALLWKVCVTQLIVCFKDIPLRGMSPPGSHTRAETNIMQPWTSPCRTWAPPLGQLPAPLAPSCCGSRCWVAGPFRARQTLAATPDTANDIHAEHTDRLSRPSNAIDVWLALDLHLAFK